MGGPSNTFQWAKDGIILANENDMFLILVNVSVSDGGTYTCTVTNEAGEEDRNSGLYIRPAITLQPTDINTTVSNDQNFTCNATGFPTPQFEWLKLEENNARNLTGNFSGENTDNLQFTPVQFGDEGDYFCQVTSGLSTVRSETARLTSKFYIDSVCMKHCLN